MCFREKNKLRRPPDGRRSFGGHHRKRLPLKEIPPASFDLSGSIPYSGPGPAAMDDTKDGGTFRGYIQVYTGTGKGKTTAARDSSMSAGTLTGKTTTGRGSGWKSAARPCCPDSTAWSCWTKSVWPCISP